MVSGQALLIAAAVALTIWLGGESIKGVKWVKHHAKCGVMKVVGKHCEPPNVP